MNESVARDVLLVRAIECDAVGAALFSADDRRYAGRAAAELAHWHAAERRTPADADHYIGQRAQLLCGKLAERAPALLGAARALHWRPWIGVALPLAALPAGALLEQVADRGHISVLAFPLLGIVLWNLAVYALLLGGWLASAGARVANRARPPAQKRGLRRWLASVASLATLTSVRPRRLDRASAPQAAALAAFASDWAACSASLLARRAARVLHLAAAAFAIGAVGGLYLRGLVLEYRAGWESTFLDAAAVHRILAILLTPAAHLLGTEVPPVDQIAAIRFGGDLSPNSPGAVGAVGAVGENAALWIHLYAVTVALVVIAPRLALGLAAGWLERRQARHFPVDLNQPYFLRLLGPLAHSPVRLRVVPFSHTPGEAELAGLRASAAALLGEGSELALRPVVAFGAEDSADLGILADDPSVPLTLALFNLAATPEPEHHGAFLDRLGAATAPRLAVLVDSSGYRRRLGAQAGGAARIAERCQAWTAFCATRGLASACVDLAAPDLARLERDLEPLLGPLPSRAAA